MKVSELIAELQKYDPEETVTLNKFFVEAGGLCVGQKIIYTQCEEERFFKETDND